ncbi:GNAT family N-acetyltransferase [Deinococcus arcticus]|uniref:GNAT family N-acetyltransferase n=1 Tax=Deinococcus arcticus TaxID=2136176 RepID=A0A2T3WA82_9DEIO|nr:GNAT family N-acetyltransferase [Deinococcus arcticus]PTA68806.1 GNAT family N-acetyltransferase [Deinococcus arcticus]
MTGAGWPIRRAVPGDAPGIAAHRAQMFTDMGDLTREAAQAQLGLWADWLAGAIEKGEYVGFVAEQSGQPLGSAGLMFHPKPPTTEDPATLRAYVLNVYVAPEGRRQGLAEALMRAVLTEVETRGLRTVTLHASAQGRSIYERLGFTEAPHPELRLILGNPATETRA